MRGFLIGLILGLVTIPVVVFAYFRFGHPPVAVGDPPLPMEARIVDVPLDARIARSIRRNQGWTRALPTWKLAPTSTGSSVRPAMACTGDHRPSASPCIQMLRNSGSRMGMALWA